MTLEEGLSQQCHSQGAPTTPRARREPRNALPPEPSGGGAPWPPWFLTSGIQNGERIKVSCFKPPACGAL